MSKYLALYKANPLELILLALTGSLKDDEVTILREKVGRLKKFVPSRLETRTVNTGLNTVRIIFHLG